MSYFRKNVHACLPLTERGKNIHLGADPKGKNFLYTNGRSVIIREIEAPENADQYSEHISNVLCARYAPSGFYIASGDSTGNVRIWDTVNAEHPLKFEAKPFYGEIRDLAWDGESKRIVAVGEGRERFGHAFLFDSGSSCGEIIGHSKVVNAVDVKSNRPFRAVTAGDDLCINWYEGPPFKYKTTIKTHEKFVNSIRYAPNGEVFVTVGADRKIFFYDGKTGEKQGEVENAHEGSIMAVSWSPDSANILTVSGDRTAKIWEVSSRKCVETFTFGNAVEDQQVGCLWQGEHLITVSLSGDINYLDRSNPSKPKRVITGHNRPTTACAASKDGKYVYTGDISGRVCAWDMATGLPSVVGGSYTHNNQIQHISIVDDQVVSCGKDDAVHTFNVGSGEYSSSSFQCDGEPSYVAVGKNDISIVVTKTGAHVLQKMRKSSHTPLKFNPQSVAINPSGTEAAIGGDNGELHIFTINGGALSQKTAYEGNRGVISALAYSPCGTMLAAGDASRQVICYDTSSGKIKVQDWIFHQARITCLSWTPDSKYCASGSIDTHVFVWSVEKPGKKIQIKNAHVGMVTGVAWTDNTTLATVGQDGVLKTWGVTHH